MAKHPSDFPKIVCLCGSTKFKEEFMEANKTLTLDGYIVVSVGFFGHADNDPVSAEQKYKLDVLHFRKLDLADEVFVVDPGGYIGDSTKREIEYARSLGKQVRYLTKTFGYINKKEKPDAGTKDTAGRDGNDSTPHGSG